MQEYQKTLFLHGGLELLNGFGRRNDRLGDEDGRVLGDVSCRLRSPVLDAEGAEFYYAVNIL